MKKVMIDIVPCERKPGEPSFKETSKMCAKIRKRLKAKKTAEGWQYRRYCNNVVEWRSEPVAGLVFKVQVVFMAENVEWELCVGLEEVNSVYNFKEGTLLTEHFTFKNTKAFKHAWLSWLKLNPKDSRERYEALRKSLTPATPVKKK